MDNGQCSCFISGQCCVHSPTQWRVLRDLLKSILEVNWGIGDFFTPRKHTAEEEKIKLKYLYLFENFSELLIFFS